MLGFISAFYIVISLEPIANVGLTGSDKMLSSEMNLLVLCGVGLVALTFYLARAATLEKLLPPAFAALGLIVGAIDGDTVGDAVGIHVGAGVGVCVGAFVGAAVGLDVGT